MFTNYFYNNYRRDSHCAVPYTNWEAISTLDAAERDYSEAWSAAMADSDLAVQVQLVRDTWDEINGGQ